MNWEAIGAVAEIVASIGVIISLIYLGVQIREQTIESRLAMGNELANQFNVTYSILASNRNFADVWLKGLYNFESLEPVERVQFSTQMGRTFRVVETMFNKYRFNRIASALWLGMDAAVRDTFYYRGAKAWWHTRKHWYCDDFQAYIEPYIESEDRVEMYGESKSSQN